MVNVMYVIGSIFEVLVTIYFLDKMLTRKMGRGMTAVIWVALSGLCDIIIFHLPVVFRLPLAGTLTLLFILVVYRESVKKKMIIWAFTEIACILAECLANSLLGYAVEVKSDKVYFMLGYIVTKIVYFIIIRVIVLLYRNNNDIKLEYKSFISILVIPVLSIILIIIIYMMKKDKVFGRYDLTIYASMLVINYITVIQYDNLQRMVYLDNKNKLLEKQSVYYVYQNQETQEMWEKMRSLKHNMKNEYVIQKMLLKDKQYDTLLQRCENLISEIEAEKNIANSGNVYIDAIINYKTMEIRNLGGEIDCCISIEKELPIHEDDIVIILGNLLDNIKDAFSAKELTDKRCRLVLIYDEPNLVIETENTYVGERIKNIREEYVTTKSDKDIHGIGLGAIKKAAEKYNGSVNISDKNNLFMVRVLLQL